MMMRVVVALMGMAPLLSEVVRRRWGRPLRARAGVAHVGHGGNRVHGWHVVRAEICRGVAVVGVVWTTAVGGRWGRAADAPRGLRVRNAVYKGRLHVAVWWGLRCRVLNADRRGSEVVGRRQRRHGGGRRGWVAVDLAGWVEGWRAVAG
jgi:hypothetical protein